MKKPNDIILKGVTKIAVVILFTFAISLFFSGHHNTGGGFIAGLTIASAITLLFLTHDLDRVRAYFPFDFKVIMAVGVLITILMGIITILLDRPFLFQTFNYFELPIFGKKRAIYSDHI